MKKVPIILENAILPENYGTYVFDLYGTLVDIQTEEDDEVLWEKLALFYGYYDAYYEAKELQEAYNKLVSDKEASMKKKLDADVRYKHEASPEIEIKEVFAYLFTKKGVTPSEELVIHSSQFFRVLSTVYVRTYPGTEAMLSNLKKKGKKVYLLSNAQRVFTEYEMHVLGIAKFFDGIMISSDYKTKKPDKRFFDIMMEQYQLDASDCLFVGNDSHTDIAGAQSIGMDTYYVCSNISPQGDWAESATYAVKEFTTW